MITNKGKTALAGILLAAAVISYSVGMGHGPENSVLQLEDGNAGTQSTAEMALTEPEKTETSVSWCYVHVCGAVRTPGVYELAEGSRGCDAIAAAGGFTEQAAEDFLNLAQPVWDGQKLYVPGQEEAKVLSESGQENGRININTASREQLMTLPGIGEARAEAILKYRREAGPFLVIEDIMKVSGIKEAAFLKIKDDITV